MQLHFLRFSQGLLSRSRICIAACLLLSATTPLMLTGCNSSTSSSTPAPALSAPTITTSPVNASAFIGDTATFTVVATGSPAPTYQWSKGGAAIAGATSATYTTPTLASADNGSSFTVTLTNSAGSVTSSAAVLTVSTKPASITSQPVDVTVTVGNAATFTVVAAGTAPISYQWSKNSVAIAGATSASYTYTPPVTDSGAVFSVVVSNSAATVTSSTAKLTVNAAPINITTQPSAATTLFVGETSTFSVVAAGTSPTYQWRKNAAAITGATSATYTTPTLAAADDKATYDVLVSNAAGTVDSTVVTLRVGPFATTYTTQQGAVLNLFAWPGAKNAFLTKTAALDGPTMRKILTAADGTWNYYAGADGALPSYYFTYTGAGANGTLATIADTGVGGVNLCGDGCTYIGATGMEISDNITNYLLTQVPNNLYDHTIFYEFGRSFWLFGNQLQYQAPADSTCEVTGFAILMQYRSISAQGYTSTYNGTAANYTSQYTNSLGMIDTYAANASLNFNNTFLTNSFSSPYGGCSDLWASMVIRLANNYGGEAFIQDIFKEALKRPTATTTQTAIDNFVLAASAAANKNLTLTFGTTWKWPISTSASQEAQSKWGSPQ